MQSKIVIVGGGPVGQTFAILLNQNVPTLDITIIEQRKDFIRPQVMLLNKTSIDLLPTEIIKTLIDGQGCYVDPPPFDRRGTCYKFPKTSLIGISLSVFERELFNYIKNKTTIRYIRPQTHKKLSLHLSENEVLINLDNQTINLKYDILIGADGVNSQVLKTFFQNQKIDLLDDTMHGLTLIIKPDQNNRIYTQKPQGLIPQLKHRQDRVRLFRQSNQSIYLAFTLSDDEYEEFLNSNDQKVPNGLKPIIKQYMKLFNIECQQNDINQCLISSSYFPIKISKASTVTDGKRFLIGDAAMNTHFFTGSGLNLGIEEAHILANLLTASITAQISNQELQKEYNLFIEKGANLIKNKVLEVRTDYDSLEKKCKSLNLPQLRTLAKSVNIPYSYLNKNELCILLNTELTFK